MDKGSAPPVRIEMTRGARPDVMVVRVHGALELNNYAEFEELTRRNDSPVLVIDLADVPYIDSAVLGSMVAVHVACARNQRKYALVNASAKIQNMMAVSGVGEILVSYPTLEEAEASL